MRAETRNRLWSAMLLTALAAALAGIVATAGAFDASILLPVMDLEQWTPAKLNPVAWWRGEDDATDSAGEHDGAWAGTETYAAGTVGKAFSFDGASQINAGSPVIGQSDWTFCAHVTVFTNLSNLGVFGQYTPTSPGRLSLLAQAQGRYWRLQLGANRYEPTNMWAVGESQHISIAYVAETKTITFYFDGIRDKAVYTGGAVNVYQGNLFIGAAASGTFMFNGIIDDVLVFNRALTPDEIALLYSKSIARDGEAWP